MNDKDNNTIREPKLWSHPNSKIERSVSHASTHIEQYRIGLLLACLEEGELRAHSNYKVPIAFSAKTLREYLWQSAESNEYINLRKGMWNIISDEYRNTDLLIGIAWNTCQLIAGRLSDIAAGDAVQSESVKLGYLKTVEYLRGTDFTADIFKIIPALQNKVCPEEDYWGEPAKR